MKLNCRYHEDILGPYRLGRNDVTKFLSTAPTFGLMKINKLAFGYAYYDQRR